MAPPLQAALLMQNSAVRASEKSKLIKTTNVNAN
jgi:hypothetical protein